jgi:pyruvate,water dikinase
MCCTTSEHKGSVVKYIYSLDHRSGLDIALAGVKGGNLSELIGAGFPVPPGFVLITDAYRDFVDFNDLKTAINSAVQNADPNQPAALARASRSVVARFSEGHMPTKIVEELSTSYQMLGAVPVAVRSSATAEDLPEASFAGQGETVLNVLGEQALLDAVKRCWASLWTARAIAYRAQRGIPFDDLALAVVVQQMVEAEIAGVLFTANPNTGDPDEVVINAAPGLGDALVSGAITPQEIIVERGTWTIKGRTSAQRRVLTSAQANSLAHLGERIESHFAFPQDIEWAWAESQFYVLQSRPVTTFLYPRLDWEPPTPGYRYMRGGATELMPDPISVLFETLFLPVMERATKQFQERLGLGTAMQDWRFVTIHGFVYGRIKPNPKMLLEALLAIPTLMGCTTLLASTVENWEQDTLLTYQREVAALRGDPAGLSSRELLRRIEALALAAARYWAVFAAVVPQLDRAERRFALLYKGLSRAGDSNAAVLLRGLANQQLKAERALYAARDGDLGEYLAEYGHVLYNFDFAVPLAGEDRAALEAIRRAWREGVPSPKERYRSLAKERKEATQRIRERLPGWLRHLFNKALAAGQKAARLREDALFDLGLAWVPLRKFALELGRRLVGAGALKREEQIFWLHHDELRSLAAGLDRGERPIASMSGQLEARCTKREAARGARAPFTLPERAVVGLVRLFVPTAEARRQTMAEELTGTGTSPGRVTAVARVIHGLEEFERLGRGDILVAPATTPAWTPLFALAGGLVTDLGGSLSHGSIIAREYGIPAVMGTGNGTEIIRDGQSITVDGGEGKVYLE